MIVSTLLLTRDNTYVKSDGSLPIRPKWDKKLLTELVRDQIISDEAENMLPPSIRDVAKPKTKWEEPSIGITIPEIDALSDLLIVSISDEIIYDNSSKKFRFDNFDLLVNVPNLQIWKRKQNDR